MTNVEVAQKMIATMLAKDSDALKSTLAENVAMNTPMGMQRGKNAVAATLLMFANMGAKPEAPTEEGGEVFAVANAPMGRLRIVFAFDGGLISNIETKVGG